MAELFDSFDVVALLLARERLLSWRHRHFYLLVTIAFLDIALLVRALGSLR